MLFVIKNSHISNYRLQCLKSYFFGPWHTISGGTSKTFHVPTESGNYITGIFSNMLHDYNFPEKVKGKRGIQPIDPQSEILPSFASITLLSRKFQTTNRYLG